MAILFINVSPHSDNFIVQKNSKKGLLTLLYILSLIIYSIKQNGQQRL